MIEGEDVTWVRLTKDKSKRCRQDDDWSAPASVHQLVERAKENSYWEDENSAPKDRGAVAIGELDVNVCFDLVAHTQRLAPGIGDFKDKIGQCPSL